MGLDGGSDSLPRNGGDTSKPLKRRKLFLPGGLAESIKLGVPVRQKFSRSVKLDDLPVLEEHNPVVIDHSAQPVRDRQDRAFSKLAIVSVSIVECEIEEIY